MGGCFSSRISDSEEEVQPIEYPPVPEDLKTIHVWSDHRDAVDDDAEKLLAYPLNELALGKPNRAECVMIDGANVKPYPFASIVCVDYPQQKIKLFWYDGYSRPNLALLDVPASGVYLEGLKNGTFGPTHYIKEPQDDVLEVLVELLRKAKANPGTYIYT